MLLFVLHCWPDRSRDANASCLGESARLGGIPVICGQLKNSSASGHHHFYLCWVCKEADWGICGRVCSRYRSCLNHLFDLGSDGWWRVSQGCICMEDWTPVSLRSYVAYRMHVGLSVSIVEKAKPFYFLPISVTGWRFDSEILGINTNVLGNIRNGLESLRTIYSRLIQGCVNVTKNPPRKSSTATLLWLAWSGPCRWIGLVAAGHVCRSSHPGGSGSKVVRDMNEESKCIDYAGLVKIAREEMAWDLQEYEYVLHYRERHVA